MRHLLLAALLVAMTACGVDTKQEDQPTVSAETAAQEDQPTAPAKEEQPTAPAETATLTVSRTGKLNTLFQ